MFGIATGHGPDDRGVGVRVPVGSRIFFSTSSRPALGPTQPPIQWVPKTLSPGVKRTGCEADHSPPTSAERKNTWTYTSTPPYAFMVYCLISYAQGQLYLYLSMALQPFVGPWPLFQFLNLFTQSVGLLGRGISWSQDRYLHTEQHKHRIRTHRHPCLEWNSNPRPQCSSGRRQFMP
jgi:hypothetical protein